MSDDVIVPFPVSLDRQLTFEQAVSTVENRKPDFGLIAGYDVDGDIFIINFGNISRENALWIAHQLIRHTQGEEIS